MVQESLTFIILKIMILILIVCGPLFFKIIIMRSALNENKFMGIIISRVNETYFQRIMELIFSMCFLILEKLALQGRLLIKLKQLQKSKNLDLVVRGVEKSNLIAQKLLKII